MKKAVNIVVFMMAATLVAKLTALLRERLIAQGYGLSDQLKAFFYANSIPTRFFELALGAAVLSTFIPIFTGILQKDRAKAFEFANKFISLIIFVTAAFVLLGIALKSALVTMIAPGIVGTEIAALTEQLLVILLPSAIFAALAFCLVGLLQSFGEFTVPAIISMALNAVVIVYMLFFDASLGIVGLAVAMLIGWAMQFVVQIPFVYKAGYRFRFRIKFYDENIKQVFKLSFPILVSSWLSPICILINGIFVSFIGSITPLEYANHLYLILVAVFTYAITNYILPKLSAMDASTQYADMVQGSLKAMFFITAPIMAGAAILSRPIITLLYSGNAFDAAAIDKTATALTFYSVSMIFMGTVEILNKSLFSQKKAVPPMIASLFGIAINVVVAAILFMGDFAESYFALAYAAGIAAGAIILAILFARFCKDVFNKKLLVFALRISASVIAMCAAVYGAYWLLSDRSALLQAVVPTAAGLIVYGGLVLLQRRKLLPAKS